MKTCILTSLLLIWNVLPSTESGIVKCYMCSGVESCSGDLATMATVRVRETDGLEPMCIRKYELGGDGRPQLVGLHGNVDIEKIGKAFCKHREEDNTEICECFGELCNGQEPPCSLRIASSQDKCEDNENMPGFRSSSA